MRYFLFSCTWLFVLASIIYLWVKNGLENTIWWMWVILTGLALIPLAGRLKVGNWFEFSKKVETLSQEVSSTQREIARVNNRLEALVSASQVQQQINITGLSEKAAKAFAESLTSVHKLSYPPSSLTEKNMLPPEKVSPTDKQRFNFIQEANIIIASVTPLIRLLYAQELAKRGKEEPERPYLIPISGIIDGLLQERESYSEDSLKEPLQTIASLVQLRQDVYQMKVKPPSASKRRELMFRAHYSAMFIEGFLNGQVTLWWQLLSPRRKPEDEK